MNTVMTSLPRGAREVPSPRLGTATAPHAGSSTPGPACGVVPPPTVRIRLMRYAGLQPAQIAARTGLPLLLIDQVCRLQPVRLTPEVMTPESAIRPSSWPPAPLSPGGNWQTLTCRVFGHPWAHQRRRGRIPTTCPEHRGMVERRCAHDGHLFAAIPQGIWPRWCPDHKPPVADVLAAARALRWSHARDLDPDEHGALT